MKHPLYVDNRTEKEKQNNLQAVEIKLVSLGDFAMTLKAYAWSNNNDDAFQMHCDVLKSVKETFDQKGIEIPFPYRTIVFKNDLLNHGDKKEK